MDVQQSRPFNDDERAFLEGVAAKLPPRDRKRLRQDIEAARVTPKGDFLNVALTQYERPPYQGHSNLPFEGEMRDADGGPISLLVNMDENDRLLAVEFIWWENSIDAAPDWSTLKIVAEPD